MTTRRKVLLAFSGLAALPAYAQQPGKVWRIGFLSFTSGPNENIEAFRDGLRSLGYIEGRNVLIEYRWAAGKGDRLPEMAAELVRLNVDVIVAQATLPVTAAKLATSTIPIVMTAPTDPVGSGLVASLAHPGGNVTGTSVQSMDLAGKDLQLARELAPKATRVAVLTQTGSAGELLIEQVPAAAERMGITVVPYQLNQTGELGGAFAAMQRARAIADRAAKHLRRRKSRANRGTRSAVPPAGDIRITWLRGGGWAHVLMFYGPSLPAMFRHAAFYVDRIFKGARPADLPVEQPTKFEMVINLRTARALGLNVPQAVLLQADEVIDTS